MGHTANDSWWAAWRLHTRFKLCVISMVLIPLPAARPYFVDARALTRSQFKLLHDIDQLRKQR